MKELRNHVIIAGYGRVGQIIAQMLSELLIPFVALDVRSDRWERATAHKGPSYILFGEHCSRMADVHISCMCQHSAAQETSGA